MWPARPLPTPRSELLAQCGQSLPVSLSTLVLLCSIVACNGDKADSATTEGSGSEDGSGETGGDESTGEGSTSGGTGMGDSGGEGTGGEASSGDGSSGEHAYFTRVFDDVYVFGELETRAVLELVAGPDGLSGSLEYTETITDNSTTICNATLNVVRVASDPDCEECEWGYTFFLEPDARSRTNGCLFASPTTSFGLGTGGYLGTLAKRATGPGDTRNVVTLGTRSPLLEYTAEHTLYAEDASGGVLVDSWDPSTGTVSGVPLQATASGAHLWQDCDIPTDLLGETTTGVPTGGTEVNDSIDCSLGPGLVDVWETEVIAGQTLLASVDHSGDDSYMWLVDPKGCLITEADDSVPCSDDRLLCPAIQHKAAQDGTFRVVVGPLYCLNPTMNYYFDGAVQ